MKIYVTFGQEHMHVVGNTILDKDCLGELECESHEEGRGYIMELFNKKFCTTYVEATPALLNYFPRGIVKIPRGAMTDG